MRHVALSPHRQAVIAGRARALRQFATVSERKLWLGLAGGRAGAAFRRQVPVAGGRFIADFCAPALGLIVEVDGGIHSRKRRADARRDEKLQRLGYTVLRLDAELVLGEPERAFALVREAMRALGRRNDRGERSQCGHRPR